jgi:hypothetical protein
MKSSANQRGKKALDEIDNDNGSLSMITTTKPVEWSPENEEILVEWCDFAQCYKWLHTRSHNMFSYMHAWFTIPAITLSTISGTASFAQSSIPAPFNTYAPMLIGTINICVGILTTVQQYLKISELNESHRVSSIAWDKFARNIRIELAKAPSERMDAAHFLKMNRQEFDRLMETSPTIKDSVINEFRLTFIGKVGTTKRVNYEELKKPDICDTIFSSNKTRHPWYLEQKPVSGIGKLDAANLDIKNKQDEEADAAERYRQMQEMLTTMTNHNATELKLKKIEAYVNQFVGIFGRRPLKEELIEHFHEDEVEDDDIASYLSKKRVDIIPPVSKSTEESKDTSLSDPPDENV